MDVKLYNGDCLEIMDKLIADNIKVDAIITDPPYGTTSCAWDSVIPFNEMWKRLNLLIKDNGAIALFGSEPFSSALRMSNIKNYKYDWIWMKNRPVGFLNAKKQPLRNTENISVFYKKQCLYKPQGIIKGIFDNNRPSRTKKIEGKSVYGIEKKHLPSNEGNYPRTILKFSNDNHNSYHPTQKPVELLEYLIKTYTLKDETVLDFTMGSGSTGVACKYTNRNFIGIELEKKYFDIAEKRINEANTSIFDF